jgi:ArsR family transcriptional regulator
VNFVEIVQLFKALADENRIRILALLTHGELCVCEIEEILKIQQSNASRHLNKLRLAGLITSEKKSQWVFYSLNDNIFVKYPFIHMILEAEFGKISACKFDYERLINYKESGMTCEQLAKNK